MLFGPAFDYDFLFGVELDRVAALAVHDAEKAVFPAAEREVRHWGGYSNIDADVSRWRFVAEAARGRSARCEQRCLIAVGIAFEERQSFVHVVGVYQAQDGSEDFRVREVAGRGHGIENGRLYEIALLVAWNFRVASVHQNFGTLFFAHADQRFDAVLTLLGNDWAHLHALVEPVAYAQIRGCVGDG